jgi:hypothetical protein
VPLRRVWLPLIAVDERRGMSDQSTEPSSRFGPLRRHRRLAAAGVVALTGAIGGALAGGVMNAVGSDESRAPRPPAISEADLGPPPPELREFQQCMEDHGAVPPAPPAPGDEEARGRTVLPADPERARGDCEPLLGPPPDDAELHARIERHVRCMGEHGVELPEPPPPEAGPFQITLPRDDPDVEAARQACDHLLFGDSGSETGNH